MISSISDDTITSSQGSFESHQGLELIPKIFAPTRCITRPLVALQRADNHKYDHKDGKELCIYLDGFDYICRICHGGDSSGDLLTPCKCKGSIAFAHLKCLEIWLNESNSNVCELCQYHFRIIREPNFFWSIFIFLRHPGRYLKDMILDFLTFAVYTPSTITATWMLMTLCESLAKSNIRFRKTIFSHMIAFVAIFGIATINFTYTSWLVLTMEKYVHFWREWYKQTCTLKVVLSAHRLVPKKKPKMNADGIAMAPEPKMNSD